MMILTIVVLAVMVLTWVMLWLGNILVKLDKMMILTIVVLAVMVLTWVRLWLGNIVFKLDNTMILTKAVEVAVAVAKIVCSNRSS